MDKYFEIKNKLVFKGSYEFGLTAYGNWITDDDDSNALPTRKI